MKDQDKQAFKSLEGSGLEEDIEEGAHFSHTQKIPISLIK